MSDVVLTVQHDRSIPVPSITRSFLTQKHPARMEFKSGPDQLLPEKVIEIIVDSYIYLCFAPSPYGTTERKGLPRVRSAAQW